MIAGYNYLGPGPFAVLAAAVFAVPRGTYCTLRRKCIGIWTKQGTVHRA